MSYDHGSKRIYYLLDNIIYVQTFIMPEDNPIVEIEKYPVAHINEIISANGYPALVYHMRQDHTWTISTFSRDDHIVKKALRNGTRMIIKEDVLCE